MTFFYFFLRKEIHEASFFWEKRTFYITEAL